MNSRVALGLSLAVLFAGTIFILARVIPGPHGKTDYLVIGTLATFFCLAILVIVNFKARRNTDLFYRRRK